MNVFKRGLCSLVDILSQRNTERLASVFYGRPDELFSAQCGFLPSLTHSECIRDLLYGLYEREERLQRAPHKLHVIEGLD